MTTDDRRILALFTYARRRHKELSRTHLASALGIRRDQVEKAESARPCGAVAERKLAEWNGIALRDGRYEAAPMVHHA